MNQNKQLKIGDIVHVGWGDSPEAWDAIKSRMPTGTILALVCSDGDVDSWRVVGRER